MPVGLVAGLASAADRLTLPSMHHDGHCGDVWLGWCRVGNIADVFCQFSMIPLPLDEREELLLLSGIEEGLLGSDYNFSVRWLDPCAVSPRSTATNHVKLITVELTMEAEAMEIAAQRIQGIVRGRQCRADVTSQQEAAAQASLSHTHPHSYPSSPTTVSDAP